MIRRIIQIDEEKCNGCGLCAQACHEGAIGMVDGKAKLLRDDYYKEVQGEIYQGVTPRESGSAETSTETSTESTEPQEGEE